MLADAAKTPEAIAEAAEKKKKAEEAKKKQLNKKGAAVFPQPAKNRIKKNTNKNITPPRATPNPNFKTSLNHCFIYLSHFLIN